ncbi:uncharacterized protein LOC125593072 [Brassica napus]|uniref:uncharacterized protein LOC125593072 n=1 Tax=Brassica napus TaxID=3708 RepID=UPI00207A1CC3|nr:uncharacterized protein LOC125593072 [Brassica napus]
MEVIVRASNKRSLFLIFLVSLVLFRSQKFTQVSAVNYTKPHRQVSSLRAERIQKHLNKINKTPVFTIQSPDGDVIDCVPKRKQPALDHPLLKHHKIQRAPTRMPQMMGKERTDDVKEAANVLESAWQMWHVNGTRCPKGTVPIRRNTMNDVLRAKHYLTLAKSDVVLTLLGGQKSLMPFGTSGHEDQSQHPRFCATQGKERSDLVASSPSKPWTMKMRPRGGAHEVPDRWISNEESTIIAFSSDKKFQLDIAIFRVDEVLFKIIIFKLLQHI